MSSRGEMPIIAGRLTMVLVGVAVAVAVLLWRAVDLQVFSRDFLQQQGDARHLRVVPIAAHRGMITDRNGEPLAVSTPVDSVWVDPRLFIAARKRWSELASLLDMSEQELTQLVDPRADRQFVYIKRHIAPERGARIQALRIPGVFLKREYRRYYPTGEVAAHVVGYTDIDDNGLEGLELQFNDWLKGEPGSKRVIKDRLGRIVEDVGSIEPPTPGRNLRVSIDRRLQYLAYRELKAAVKRHHARAGSAVLLDAHTGEVLAMVNQPGYNPNNLTERGGARSRNRAVTDIFEPGSTVKPFTVAAALESGKYRPHTLIDTSPGILRLGSATVRDHRNYGLIDVATVIKKSSNVGASRMALSMPPDKLWGILNQVGFGLVTGSGFPGEAAGVLPYRHHWSRIQRATLSFGYGLSVTPLQLAHAYAVLADDGLMRPATLLAATQTGIEQPADVTRVMAPETARQIRLMLQGAVSEGGTGTRAQVPGYRVAGKTGTAHKVGANGYADDRYVALFAGMAPVSHPRFVMAVVIDEPSTDEYYGGLVAAPVFGRVMAGALRLLDVPPDDVKSLNGQLANAEEYLR